MKTPSLALLNSIGFTNFAQKALYAATILKAATVQSPQIQVSAPVTAVIGKRAVPGYDGFGGFAAQTEAQNTTGKLVGEVFPGRPAVAAQTASNGYAAVKAIPELPASPAYPVGTAIPNYPVVAARQAVAEVIPVVAKLAIVAPAITPLVGYADAVSIEDLSNGVIEITAYFPQATAAKLIGSTVTKTLEITPASATPLLWVGDKASNVPGLVISVPQTLEEYFLDCAGKAINLGVGAGSITTEDRLLGGTVKTCTKVSLKVQRDETANYANADLQLATVGYYEAPTNGGGDGSQPMANFVQ